MLSKKAQSMVIKAFPFENHKQLDSPSANEISEIFTSQLTQTKKIRASKNAHYFVYLPPTVFRGWQQTLRH